LNSLKFFQQKDDKFFLAFLLYYFQNVILILSNSSVTTWHYNYNRYIFYVGYFTVGSLGPIYPIRIIPGPIVGSKYNRHAPGVIRPCQVKVISPSPRQLKVLSLLYFCIVDGLSTVALKGSWSGAKAPSRQAEQ